MASNRAQYPYTNETPNLSVNSNHNGGNETDRTGKCRTIIFNMFSSEQKRAMPNIVAHGDRSLDFSHKLLKDFFYNCCSFFPGSDMAINLTDPSNLSDYATSRILNNPRKYLCESAYSSFQLRPEIKYININSLR
jgi:hypothetical protein